MTVLAALNRTLADSSDRDSWNEIPRYAGFYEASHSGRIRSVPRTVIRSDGSTATYRGRMLSAGMGSAGYLIVSLYRGGRRTKHTERVHVLVAEAFHGMRPAGLDVMHIDADRTNNAAMNLRYGSRAENIQQVVDEGNHNQKSKVTCLRGHLLQMPNLERSRFESTGWRECLACKRARHVRQIDAGLSFDERADLQYVRIMGVAA